MKKIITAFVLAGIIFLFGGCGKNISSVNKQDFVEDISSSEESEQATSEKEHSENNETTQADVVTKPNEAVTLSSFIGKTVKEITDMFGTDYSVYDYNGGYFISYEDQPFSFFYRDPASDDGSRSDVPAPKDEIFIVMSGGEGVAIFDGVEIGSRAAALRLHLGEKLDIEYDEMNDEYFTTFTQDGLRYVVYVNEDTVITSCEVWDERV